MPIYEYLCEGCAYRFEAKQSIKDDPIATCERCGKAVKRLISSPAIMFKGSGWYVTDYSDKLKPPSSGEPVGATDGEKKKDAATTQPDSAPATATASPTTATPAASPTTSAPATAPASSSTSATPSSK